MGLREESRYQCLSECTSCILPVEVFRMRIEVLATDGSSLKRVLWIYMNKGGIYAGWCLRGLDIHTSYHPDGTRWISIGGDPPIREDDGPPLGRVEGFLQFTGFVFPATLDKIHSAYPPYRRKKSTERVDSVYYIDPSFFPHGAVACNIYLVEPHEVQNLPHLPTTGVAHIVTHGKPWVAIVFSHVRMQ